MSAPFRDLFVELPAALFEVLKGAAEQAVKQATKPEPAIAGPHYSTLDALDSAAVKQVLLARYGWAGVSVWRSAIDRAFEFGVRWPCQHKSVLAVDDRVLLEHPVHMLDALDVAAESHGRPCFCMQREVAS